MKHTFSLELKEDVWRKMGRAEYYIAASYLRKLRRAIDIRKITWDEEREIKEVAMYGRAEKKLNANTMNCGGL